jgi:hypothetical protein
MNGGDEVAVGLVVAGGDGAELFEFGEEIFDEVASLVDLPVEGLWVHAMSPGWDDGCYPACGQRFEHPFVGIEGTISDQYPGLEAWQEHVGRDNVRRLARRQCKGGWTTKPIDHGQDLGRQPPERTADGLPATRFLGAPALC